MNENGSHRGAGIADPRKLARLDAARERVAARLGTAPRFDPAKLARLQPARDRLAARMDPNSGWFVDRRVHGEEILTVSGLSIRFGGLQALDQVAVVARTGEVTGVIGPNGAGKTTFFNCVSGLYAPDSGEITYEGRPLRGSVVSRGRLGLGRTFQTPRLFASLSVLDNLLLGCAVAGATGRPYQFEPSLLRLALPERAERIARIVGFRGDLRQPAGGLSFGDLRVVEFARALCAAPRVLMLDEPASGLDTERAGDLVRLLRRLADLGLAILLIEHDMSFVMGLCDTITVLDFGTVLAQGTPTEVQTNEAVIEAYLGRSA
ncbi:MAG TPA: ABC transporter ATP-binding protein [Candidatus Dormibacteraeota bacterium]|nr:ABC transporter ATP-binding protein [Candidatus Dormibacteraeota bacterium]